MLNGVEALLELPPGPLNSTAAARALLQSAAAADPGLAHDPAALASITGWVHSCGLCCKEGGRGRGGGGGRAHGLGN